MQDINKSRVELRDSQTQTREYISTFEPLALRLCLYLEGISIISTKETIPYTKGGHISNKPLYKRWAQSHGTKLTLLYTRGKHKANKGYNTW